MQSVYLVGGIEKFGPHWEAECSNIRDIFRLIDCQTPGFRKYLVDAAEAGVGFEIQRGEEFLEEPEEMLLSLNNEDIIITEVPAGSKSAGSKILAAIAIITVAIMLPGSFTAALTGTSTQSALVASATVGLTMVAVNLAIAGITQLLAPGPQTDEGTDPSYLFNGPQNTIAQGLPVPVAYGELIVGGMPISVSYTGGAEYAKNIDTGSRWTFIEGGL
jgi:predicted phage tail protein